MFSSLQQLLISQPVIIRMEQIRPGTDAGADRGIPSAPPRILTVPQTGKAILPKNDARPDRPRAIASALAKTAEPGREGLLIHPAIRVVASLFHHTSRSRDPPL
jgi:hypothetical protein